MNILPAPSPTEAAESPDFAAGFQRVEAEIRAVPARDLATVNIDVPTAVASVLGSLPALRALRHRFAELPGFDLTEFDRLRDYALALGHVHGRYRTGKAPDATVARLAEELAVLRGILQADAAALARRRIIDDAPLVKLRSGNGYANMAFEVVGLVSLLREHWESIERRTALVPAELEHAARRAQQLVTALGIRQQAPDQAAAVILLRRQAFTVLLRAYGQARRAVTYVRWNERDAQRIAPSLFRGRGTRRHPAPEAETAEPSSVQPPSLTSKSTESSAATFAE